VKQIAEAAAAALAGKLIVIPTDTVYGIGTRPDDPAATARLFEAKGRTRDLTLPVLVPSVGAARRIARFDERAERLAAAFWPGALTIVLPRADESRDWDLGDETGTIGVRMPRHPLTLAVLEATGPLAVTSANRSGEAPAATCDELTAIFGDDVAVYVCEEEARTAAASTVVDVAADDVRILRLGEVGEADVRHALG
jgi:tRNA threonylcarbamoyl adenosine modification protein (Sua5/YciO/YrdC/YwlC family)